MRTQIENTEIIIIFKYFFFLFFFFFWGGGGVICKLPMCQKKKLAVNRITKFRNTNWSNISLTIVEDKHHVNDFAKLA